MNIIEASTPKPNVLGILDTKCNVVYRGEQSGKLYLGSRSKDNTTAYLVDLGSAFLHWKGQCDSDQTFVAVEADVVIKN